ncbi:hypothetical protein AAHC03_020753 [Spirometra sp. Aus1]
MVLLNSRLKKNDSANFGSENHRLLKRIEDQSDWSLFPNDDSSGNDPSTSESDIQKPERLSESLNKRFEQQQADRERQHDLVTTQLQGRGCPLGEIPLIEASIKKSKPADLKLLHFAAFGRPGSVHEIRTNLRRFRGFVFTKSAPEYTRREELLNKRPAILIREALRVLNLEVSGSRPQLVSRLIDFLCSPSADSVKYKGKLHKKQRRSRNSSGGDKKTKRASGAPRGRKRKATTEEEEDDHEGNSESDEGEAGKKEQSGTGDDKKEQAEEEDSSEVGQASDDSDDEVYSPGSRKTKKARKKVTPKRAKTKLASPASVKKVAAKTEKSAPKKRRTIMQTDDEEEDELPLAKMVPEKQNFPSDEELKSRVVELLKTSNLQETSMKVVRNSVSL